ncbi:arginine deiminase [Salipaludibacillus sp. CF4.18]|uniref:arginine deiminase n=1 Tax=Salipaludibacillus sp. CF4.18 TaxID=3373081 RepID=UPI003EE4E005
MQSPLNIYSEIGTLEKVMVHRPGKEIENLFPEFMKEFLFDDIPNLRLAQKEHDKFVEVLSSRGAEVLYVTDLASAALTEKSVREVFIDEFLTLPKQLHRDEESVYKSLKEYLLSKNPTELVETLIRGIRKEEVFVEKRHKLAGMLDHPYPFYLDPLVNMYFTRDPYNVIGNGISLNPMNQTARKNETIFMKYIMNHHPEFKDADTPIIYDKSNNFSIEGGDQLILTPEVMAIGISARTSPHAIEVLFKKLLSVNKSIKKIVAIQIPEERAFMHLDTVFTQVDTNKFTVHPAVIKIADEMNLFVMETDENGEIIVEKRTNLVETLKEVLELDDIILIPIGNGHVIEAAREQWNDGSNTLALAPGVVVTYDRNYITNETLRSHGVEVLEVPSSELSRGRGGPRCMTMPISRRRV